MPAMSPFCIVMSPFQIVATSCFYLCKNNFVGNPRPSKYIWLTMQAKKYLQRINYAGSPATNLETLSKLQLAHLLAVPFENLDIHNHVKIDLLNLYDKIVIRRRGGFCYELNGLFYELLKEIGFDVKMVSARVHDGKNEYSPEFDHMALIVALKKSKYLVDVGFGDFSLSPIKIEYGKETNDATGIFKIERFDDNYIAVQKRNAEGNFIPEYIFSEKQRQLHEFAVMCQYHQTNPASHFMKKRVCSLPTANGRITLAGNTLKIKDKGKTKLKQLKNEAGVKQALSGYFGIML